MSSVIGAASGRAATIVAATLLARASALTDAQVEATVKWMVSQVH